MMVAADVKKYYDFKPNAFQRFGAPRDGGKRKHRGTDLSHSKKTGTLVPALLGGKVIGKLAPASWHGFGYQVTIAGSFGGRKYEVSYGHGTKTSPFKVGQSVDQGDFVSTEGLTGAATGACVHVEVYDVAARKFIDPMILIKKVLAAPAPKPAGGKKTHPPTVRYGNRGATVKKLQQILVKRNHPMKADGVFGPRTLDVVKAVQRKHRLVVDGVVGPKTWAVLGQ